MPRLRRGHQLGPQSDGTYLEVSSNTLPTLPTPTITSNYGPLSMCGFQGTIVVGGPLTLTVGKSFYGYSTMIGSRS